MNAVSFPKVWNDKALERFEDNPKDLSFVSAVDILLTLNHLLLDANEDELIKSYFVSQDQPLMEGCTTLDASVKSYMTQRSAKFPTHISILSVDEQDDEFFCEFAREIIAYASGSKDYIIQRPLYCLSHSSLMKKFETTKLAVVGGWFEFPKRAKLAYFIPFPGWRVKLLALSWDPYLTWKTIQSRPENMRIIVLSHEAGGLYCNEYKNVEELSGVDQRMIRNPNRIEALKDIYGRIVNRLQNAEREGFKGVFIAHEALADQFRIFSFAPGEKELKDAIALESAPSFPYAVAFKKKNRSFLEFARSVNSAMQNDFFDVRRGQAVDILVKHLCRQFELICSTGLTVLGENYLNALPWLADNGDSLSAARAALPSYIRMTDSRQTPISEDFLVHLENRIESSLTLFIEQYKKRGLKNVMGASRFAEIIAPWIGREAKVDQRLSDISIELKCLNDKVNKINADVKGITEKLDVILQSIKDRSKTLDGDAVPEPIAGSPGSQKELPAIDVSRSGR